MNTRLSKYWLHSVFPFEENLTRTLSAININSRPPSFIRILCTSINSSLWYPYVLIGIFDYHSTFIVFGRRFRVLLQISNGLVILDITRYPSESSSALILSIRLTRPLFPFMSRHLLTPVFFERLIRAN